MDNCKQCEGNTNVPHDNCLYKGKAIGHSASHCTADSCY
jgi:hypothetical protein